MGGFEQRPWTPTKRRGQIAAELRSPGPACVGLPQLLGTRILESNKTAAPAFSFGTRYMNKNLTYGPGPAQYNITGLAAKGKDTPPQISLQSRAKPNKIIETPAPGEYHIEKSDKFIVSAAPKFTFGVKKYCGITNYSTPAPNVYKIPTVLGSSKEGPIRSAPAYSIQSRVKAKLPQCVQFPGPGSYDAKLDYMLKKPPIFSMASRYNIPSDISMKPGPGAHRPEKLNLGHVPSYSFGIKHSEYLGHFREVPIV